MKISSVEKCHFSKEVKYQLAKDVYEEWQKKEKKKDVSPCSLTFEEFLNKEIEKINRSR